MPIGVNNLFSYGQKLRFERQMASSIGKNSISPIGIIFHQSEFYRIYDWQIYMTSPLKIRGFYINKAICSWYFPPSWWCIALHSWVWLRCNDWIYPIRILKDIWLRIIYDFAFKNPGFYINKAIRSWYFPPSWWCIAVHSWFWLRCNDWMYSLSRSK